MERAANLRKLIAAKFYTLWNVPFTAVLFEFRLTHTYVHTYVFVTPNITQSRLVRKSCVKF